MAETADTVRADLRGRLMVMMPLKWMQTQSPAQKSPAQSVCTRTSCPVRQSRTSRSPSRISNTLARMTADIVDSIKSPPTIIITV